MNTLTEIWGAPGSGKSHTAHTGWPNVLHIDTAFTSIGFRKLEVDASEDGRGETWPVVKSLYGWDSEAAESHYYYLTSWPNSLEFIGSEIETVVLDNAADLKVLAARSWAEQTGNEWPQREQWGEVNDKIDGLLRELTSEYHVVVVSQLKDEYVDGDKTGQMVRDGPKRMQYKADLRLRMRVNDENERQALMVKNRFMDTTSVEMPMNLGATTSLDTLLSLADVPNEEW